MFDPWTGFLITGDTIYHGRLYAFDFPAFLKSLERLSLYAQEKSPPFIMGSHVEMTRTPGKDYPATARYQPEEPPLQMSVDQLIKVKNAASSVKDKHGAHVFEDFIIFNGPSYGAMLKQLIRARIFNLMYKLGRIEESEESG